VELYKEREREREKNKNEEKEERVIKMGREGKSDFFCI